MISQLIKLAVIGISAVFLIAAAVVFWKKTRNQTKSQTKAELKKLKIFRMSALLFAIIMCFSSTLALYFDTTRQSSAVIALNYAEASLGQNVNGTRYNMSEIICDDVIERVIKKGGFTDLSVDDLKSCFSVVPLNQGNSYSKENYHISTEFAVYYNASKKTKKYDTNAIAQLLCNSYRDYYFDNYVNDFQFDMSNFEEEIKDLDYIDIATLLQNKANYILNYLYGLREKNSAFISSNGSTFASVASKVALLNSAQISDSIYSFVLQNGISQDNQKLINRYTYANKMYSYDRLKLQDSYDITNKAIAKYDKDMARIVLVPTWDNDGQYYMGRTKIGIDTLSVQSVAYSNNIANLEKSIKDNELKIQKFTEASGNTEENKAYVSELIESTTESLKTLAEEARLIGREYYSSQMNQCISATVYQASVLSKAKNLIVIALIAYISCWAFVSSRSFARRDDE